MSKASDIVEYVGSIVLAHNGTILDLTDPEKLSYIQNMNEPFEFTDAQLPYTQLYLSLARSLTKTENVERCSMEVLIQTFFRPSVNDGAHNGLDIAKIKQDVSTEMRAIIDQIERVQITDPSAPDVWLENPSSVSVEKSTLYSLPDELYPPYMASAAFTIFFDEEYA